MEAGIGAVLRAGDLGKQLSLLLGNPLDPGVIGGKHRLCSAQISRERAHMLNQAQQLSDLADKGQGLLLAGDGLDGMGEVLQLAGGVEGLQ